MELDPNTAQYVRKYPSVRDYYRSSVRDKNKAIQLQKGLSNYSGLTLGDDRISVNESILNATYRVTVEDKMQIPSPSKNKVRHARRRDYQEATEKVGEAELNRLERVMKDKLFQRSYMTSSPFQVRKAFKFFDRENAMRIHIEGWSRALEFLGFQFSELQNLALFARYDPNCTGEIDYMNFIEKAMFYGLDDKEHLPVSKKQQSREKQTTDELYHVADIDENELRILQEAEMKRIYQKVNPKGGNINQEQFELLLLAVGLQSVTPRQLDQFWWDIGLAAGGECTFSQFFEWWSSDGPLVSTPLSKK